MYNLNDSTAKFIKHSLLWLEIAHYNYIHLTAFFPGQPG